MHVTQTPLKPVTLVILVFLALVVVTALPCSVVEEVYSLGFSPRADFYRYGFSYFSIHESYSAFESNVGLFARGQCDSQVVMMFWNYVYALIFGFLWWLF
jgi:hypothetical protein